MTAPPVNWIDGVVGAVLLFYTIHGWETGVVFLVANLISFIISLWLAVRYHQAVGGFLSEKFGVTPTWAGVVGYIIIAIAAEGLLSKLGEIVIERLPEKIVESKVNKWLGAIVAAVNGLLIVTFFMVLIVSLPLRGTIRKDIQDSTTGKILLPVIEKYGGQIKIAVDEVKQQALKFFTVSPGSKERVTIDVAPKSSDLKVDTKIEERLISLVNQERSKVGLPQLRMDTAMTQVARVHSRDMFERQYFSHVNPEGRDGADRMREGGVPYVMMGENLAYSPDVETAHQGLMNSEGHKKNILEPKFHRIGVGIVTTDTYGMMITQLFAD